MSTLSTTNIKHPSSASNNVVLDSSARVLVGTSSSIGAGGLVQSHSTGGNNFDAGMFAASTGGAEINLQKSRNTTIGSHTVVNSGDELGSVHFWGSDGSAFKRGAKIAAEVDGTPGTNDMPGRLVFSTTADGASSPTERMRLDSSGNLKFNSGYGSVATAYGCRAWVNFNGGGTVAIRASGNVSSITDNGSGDYTINFATNMPDGNYCAAVSNAGIGFSYVSDALIGIKSVAASNLRIFSTYIYGTDRGSYDQDPVMVAIFR